MATIAKTLCAIMYLSSSFGHRYERHFKVCLSLLFPMGSPIFVMGHTSPFSGFDEFPLCVLSRYDLKLLSGLPREPHSEVLVSSR
jgi:hypothetical protein